MYVCMCMHQSSFDTYIRSYRLRVSLQYNNSQIISNNIHTYLSSIISMLTSKFTIKQTWYIYILYTMKQLNTYVCAKLCTYVCTIYVCSILEGCTFHGFCSNLKFSFSSIRVRMYIPLEEYKWSSKIKSQKPFQVTIHKM